MLTVLYMCACRCSNTSLSLSLSDSLSDSLALSFSLFLSVRTCSRLCVPCIHLRVRAHTRPRARTRVCVAGGKTDRKAIRSSQTLTAPNNIEEEDEEDDVEEEEEEESGRAEGSEKLKAGIRAEMDLWLGEAEKEFGVSSDSAKVAEFVARLLCERLPALIAVHGPQRPSRAVCHVWRAASAAAL